jgi:hypothetical protein
MRIEAVTVCVDYGDFLAATLPHTLPLVDDLVIVTAPHDRETQRVCRRWGVRCLVSELHHRHGAAFNKARLINHGLNHLPRRDWLLHLDADVVLPPNARLLLANAELDPDCIYGVDRCNCPSFAEWTAFLAQRAAAAGEGYLVHPPRSWPVGSRISHTDYGGYLPIGFFQLWHSRCRIRYAVAEASDAEHTDVLHAAEWPRDRRRLIPEFFAIHLESEPATMGANWHGRTTQRFGPVAPDAAAVPMYG